MGVSAVYTPKDYSLDTIMVGLAKVVERAIAKRRRRKGRRGARKSFRATAAFPSAGLRLHPPHDRCPPRRPGRRAPQRRADPGSAATSPALRPGAAQCPVEPSRPDAQGGGIAVVAATLVPAGILLAPTSELLTLGLAAVALALVGLVDDLRPLPALRAPRPPGARRGGGGDDERRPPAARGALAVERAVAILAGLWFVNLVNFMDGLDWMTVAEVVPIAGALVGLGLAGHLATAPLLVAACLLGAVLGFAPFNGRWRGSSSAMSARCRSDCCWHGCSTGWRGRAGSPPLCCCLCTISPTRP